MLQLTNLQFHINLSQLLLNRVLVWHVTISNDKTLESKNEPSTWRQHEHNSAMRCIQTYAKTYGHIRSRHPSFTDDDKTRLSVQAAKQKKKNQQQLSEHCFIFIEHNFFLQRKPERKYSNHLKIHHHHLHALSQLSLWASCELDQSQLYLTDHFHFGHH